MSVINKLSDKEFHSFFSPPMRLIDAGEDTSGIDIREYTLQVLDKEHITIPINKIEIPFVYTDCLERYEFIHLSFGIENSFIVLVTNKEHLLGYYLLDLEEKY